jgi:hypothetical protein
MHTPVVVLRHRTISSNAFRTQEWSNLARDDVSRLRKTPPLVSFLVGLLGILLLTPPTVVGCSELYVV